MKTAKNVLVSTTHLIEGVKITKHLQPVSAHIVLGVNVFSDFLGGLTDVFGGRSNSYQKRLNSIYEDAIIKIKETCHDIGGNCVLGLKIDIDEISGKGKSMFMITAIGTAVLAELEMKEGESQNKISRKISKEEINDLRYKNHILSKIKDGSLRLDKDIWRYIIKNQIEEAFPFLINLTLEFSTSDYTSGGKDDFFENFKFYIDNLQENKKIEYLYSTFSTQESLPLKNKICDFIKKIGVLDIDKTIELIENESMVNKKFGLLIASFDKQYYDIKDVDGFERIKKSIENSFDERGRKTTKKQMLSSKDKEIWICECDHQNSIEYEYCGKCYNDIYGFKRDEYKYTPAKVIKHLDEKIKLIQVLIK